MKKVLAFGTFDVVHPGHRYFFEQCKKHGDHLTVVVARDSTVVQVKGRPPVFREEERRAAVASIPGVEEAVLGDSIDKHKVIRDIGPDVICLGYDQSAFVGTIGQKLKEFGLRPQIVRINALKPDVYKSTLVKQRVQAPVLVETLA